MKYIFRLLPVAAALVITLLMTSCTPQKQYGCPNHLESSSTID
jgi:hypothetical protein